MRVKISGHSMEPNLMDGSFLRVSRLAYLFRKPQIGDVVVFKMGKEFFCKRIKEIDYKTGTCEVLGDNPNDSLDSRKLGRIQLREIVGKVIQ